MKREETTAPYSLRHTEDICRRAEEAYFEALRHEREVTGTTTTGVEELSCGHRCSCP